MGGDVLRAAGLAEKIIHCFEIFLLKRIGTGYFVPRSPNDLIIVVSKCAENLGLAEAIPMVPSRAFGRMPLSQ